MAIFSGFTLRKLRKENKMSFRTEYTPEEEERDDAEGIPRDESRDSFSGDHRLVLTDANGLPFVDVSLSQLRNFNRFEGESGEDRLILSIGG